ncbi:MAG TPA: hypothetical protein DCQ26_13965 [Marinilabiliales bacterium]|jgi:ferric-dicitrate binding protein FerR (iron transport regulator)|nr:MAG: hypothetical protein A2W95_00085 [Bacteroidetes bacterium GWA2_40_14]OFZ27679.1 MAG: hypothetical protein A2437_01800 [Bacteroidetes bacterium RIFOXYC2_FULL_40_12]HAM99707.1 hypothetical protein [Marinilabiliales bacterium]HAZ01096.1 hypothetical protein [Marinilabiliales bacterium]HBO75188.1 hypothetical protein [Marinilabiliales bacterium]
MERKISMEAENHRYNQIIDFLADAMTPQEKDQFKQWLNQSENNKELFLRVKIFWEKSEKDAHPSSVEAWDKIRQTIKDQNGDVLKMRFIKLSVAASLLLLLTSGWLIYQAKQNLIYYATNENSFRKDTLDDGSIIYLYPSSSIQLRKDKNILKLSGAAYFVVPKNCLNPLTVQVGGTNIKVKGTSFRVNLGNQKGDISLMVESGEVEWIQNHSHSQSLLVHAGEQAYFSNLQKSSWKEPKKEDIYIIYQPKLNHQ